jgi:hypothetical protein
MITTSILHPLPDLANATYAVVKEKVISDFSGITVLTKSFLREAYLDKIMSLVESGIIENIMSYYKSKNPPKNDEPAALSLDQLLIWFQLWAGLMMIAVSFLLLEISIMKIAKVLMRKSVKALKQIWESFGGID